MGVSLQDVMHHVSGGNRGHRFYPRQITKSRGKSQVQYIKDRWVGDTRGNAVPWVTFAFYTLDVES